MQNQQWPLYCVRSNIIMSSHNWARSLPWRLWGERFCVGFWQRRN